MILRALDAFPPVGSATDDALGGRLRDRLFTAEELTGPTRAALAGQLQAAVQDKRYAEAAVLLEATLDTWPVAALVEGCRARWAALSPMDEAQGRPADLDLLARAAALISVARGWAPFGRGPWPLPDADTLRALAPEGATQVARCLDREDAAAEIAAALGLPLQDFGILDGPLAVVDATRVLKAGPVLVPELLSGRTRAVAWSGPPPEGPEAQLMWGELQMEASHQAPFERYGAAGLRVPAVGEWTDLLLPPEPGAPGEALKPVVTWAILPGTPATLAAGEVKPVCTLFFPGPRRPVPVMPVVAPLLAWLEGQGPPPPLRPDQRQSVLDQLVALGAVSAA